jgi:mono/diheme cytochrome c family protein
MRLMLIAAGALLAASAAPSLAPALAQPADPFPAGAGHDVVAAVCTQCHTAAPIVQMRMGEVGWRHQTELMILRGAQIGPDDIEATANYLATAFGPGVPFPSQPRRDVKLAGGEGAVLVENGCVLCHGLDRVVAANRPGQQWQAIVHRMVEVGAPLDGDQAKQVVTYLQAHYAGAAPAR